jgi:hypothetical protein
MRSSIPSRLFQITQSVIRILLWSICPFIGFISAGLSVTAGLGVVANFVLAAFVGAGPSLLPGSAVLALVVTSAATTFVAIGSFHIANSLEKQISPLMGYDSESNKPSMLMVVAKTSWSKRSWKVGLIIAVLVFFVGFAWTL